MSLVIPPFYDRIARWKNSGGTDNVPYASFGLYRGYPNDGGAVGQTHTWAQKWEAHTGRPLERIMGSMSLSLSNHTAAIKSFTGCPQHITIQVPLTNGGGLSGTSGLDSTWQAIVDDITAAGLDHAHVSICLGWEAGFGSFDWAIGVRSQTAGQYAAAFAHVVAVMQARGFTGTFMYDVTGMSAATMAAAYPGDASVDIIGFHGYNGIINVSATPRTNVPLWLSNDRQVTYDAVTAFAVTHGKLAGESEWCIEIPAAADTTSNVFKFHTIDNTLFVPWKAAYWKSHAYTWTGGDWFNQDQGQPSTSEFNQRWYFGTDPATQGTYPHDTSGTGTVYDAISAGSLAHATLSTAAHLLASMPAGSMQLDPGGTGGVILPTTGNRPRIVLSQAF